jgi:hypothetical protein
MVNLKFARCSFHNFFFDCALGDKTINYYLFLLANTVGSIDCLKVDLRVPIAIEDYNDVGTVKVNS